MFTAIIVTTAVWVALILCARYGHCKMLRDYMKRNGCSACAHRDTCIMFKAASNCEAHSGIECCKKRCKDCPLDRGALGDN